MRGICQFLPWLALSMLLSSCTPIYVSYYQPENIGPLATSGSGGPRDELTLMFEEKAGYKIWLGKGGVYRNFTLVLTFQVAESVSAQLTGSQIKVRALDQKHFQPLIINELKRYIYHDDEGQPAYETIPHDSIIIGATKAVPGWSDDDVTYYYKSYHVSIELPSSIRKETIEVILPPIMINGKRFEPQPIKFTFKRGVFIYSIND